MSGGNFRYCHYAGCLERWPVQSTEDSMPEYCLTHEMAVIRARRPEPAEEPDDLTPEESG